MKNDKNTAFFTAVQLQTDLMAAEGKSGHSCISCMHNALLVNTYVRIRVDVVCLCGKGEIALANEPSAQTQGFR